MIFKILSLHGIPTVIINAIKILYSDTSATVHRSDICAEILQGDTLAPFLFMIVLDYVLRMSVDKMKDSGLEIHPRRSTRYPAQYLTDTDFADDIALISGSLFNAQNLLLSLESAAKCVGLHFNESKTNKTLS